MIKKTINVCVWGLIILFTLNACSQRTTYEINGVAEGVKDGFEVELFNIQTRKSIAKTKVKDGKFHFEGSVKEPLKARLLFGRRYNDMVLENAEYKVLKGKYFNYIDGGEINNKVFGYALEPAYQQIKKEHALAPDPFKGVDRMNKEAVKKATAVMMSQMRKEWNYAREYQQKIITGNYPTLVKLFALTTIQGKDYTFDKKIELYNKYEKELGAHPLLVQERDMMFKGKKVMEVDATVKPGKPYKEVVGATKDGKQLKLSEVIAKNKYTLLEMWASWCSPCRGEFPHLKKAYAHHHAKGFEIFALSLDTKKKAWLKAMNEENVPWINVVDYKGFKGKGPKDYGVTGIPSSFLIDQNGIIVASMQEARGFALDEKLEELLGK